MLWLISLICNGDGYKSVHAAYIFLGYHSCICVNRAKWHSLPRKTLVGMGAAEQHFNYSIYYYGFFLSRLVWWLSLFKSNYIGINDTAATTTTTTTSTSTSTSTSSTTTTNTNTTTATTTTTTTITITTNCYYYYSNNLSIYIPSYCLPYSIAKTRLKETLLFPPLCNLSFCRREYRRGASQTPRSFSCSHILRPTCIGSADVYVLVVSRFQLLPPTWPKLQSQLTVNKFWMVGYIKPLGDRQCAENNKQWLWLCLIARHS